MCENTKEDLEGAKKAILSALHKSEKALDKLKPNSTQYRQLASGINAYHIALSFMEKKPSAFSKQECLKAIQFFDTTIKKVEKFKPKFKEGTPQHTLTIRRIAAFQLAIKVIEATLSNKDKLPFDPIKKTAFD